MDVVCTMYPVEDIETSAKMYLDIGFRDIARPDQDTVLLAPPGSPYVELMLERHPVEAAAGPGPVFRVPSVAEFVITYPHLNWMFGPFQLPVGDYALFRDPANNPIRLVDFTTESRYSGLFRPKP